jgi:hypothetical protein
VKKNSNDFEKVCDAYAQKAFLSHRCSCHLVNGTHPFTGRVVRQSQNIAKHFWGVHGAQQIWRVHPHNF